MVSASILGSGTECQSRITEIPFRDVNGIERRIPGQDGQKKIRRPARANPYFQDLFRFRRIERRQDELMILNGHLGIFGYPFIFFGVHMLSEGVG